MSATPRTSYQTWSGPVCCQDCYQMLKDFSVESHLSAVAQLSDLQVEGDIARLCSHWSSFNITAISLVERSISSIMVYLDICGQIIFNSLKYHYQIRNKIENRATKKWLFFPSPLSSDLSCVLLVGYHCTTQYLEYFKNIFAYC